jgi:hypothetical protein
LGQTDVLKLGQFEVDWNLALSGSELVDRLAVEKTADGDDIFLFALKLEMSSSTHVLTLLNSGKEKLVKISKN